MARNPRPQLVNMNDFDNKPTDNPLDMPYGAPSKGRQTELGAPRTNQTRKPEQGVLEGGVSKAKSTPLPRGGAVRTRPSNLNRAGIRRGSRAI